MIYSWRMPSHLRDSLLAGTIGERSIPHGDAFYYLTGARGGDASHDDSKEPLGELEVEVSDRAAEHMLKLYCDALEMRAGLSSPDASCAPNDFDSAADQTIAQAVPDMRPGPNANGTVHIPTAVGGTAIASSMIAGAMQ